MCVCVCDTVCACVCWRRVLGLRGYLATLAPQATCGRAAVGRSSLPLSRCAHDRDLIQSPVVDLLNLHRAEFGSMCGFTCVVNEYILFFLFLAAFLLRALQGPASKPCSEFVEIA